MLSGIRKRFTYANVAMTLALVFAMSGGAYAASRYVITSAKQISPKVLRSLQSKAGAQGPAGSAGAQGAAGAAGAKGDTGAAGAGGTNGTNGTNGQSVTSAPVLTSSATCNHQGGSEFTAATGKTTACNGTTGFTSTLPSHKTETGTWIAQYNAANAAEFFRTPISFPIPLAQPAKVGEAAHAEFLASGATANCPGSASEPTAEPGYLCVYVYEGEIQNAVFVSFLNLEAFGGFSNFTSRFGDLVSFKSEVAGPASTLGSWAVTAE